MYTTYTDAIRLTIIKNGDWHAELFDNTPGNKLKYVTGHPNVEAVMIKGPFETAKIGDPRRPYLITRHLTANYWNYMSEHNMVIEGHVPKSENELAISKQYFETHPNLKIGDTISIPVGNRTLNKETLDPLAIQKKDEIFVSTTQCTYTIVGKMDVATDSTIPGYISYGYMEESNIKPDNDLVVYIHFKNPRTTYQDIIQIAKSIGYKPDEYGNYNVKTNDELLTKYFIFPSQKINDIKISQLSMPLMFMTLGLLVVALFILIINNAFAMSANARLKQLGMLQSIGASPKQIRRSITFESLVLSLVPIPLGLFIGWLLDYGLFYALNNMDTAREYDTIFTFGLPAILPSIIFALLTVWLSAVIPSRKITKLSPIDAIRQGGDIKVNKIRKLSFIEKAFGLEGELAKNTLYARKKSYRTALFSLTISFLLLTTFLNFFAMVDADSKINKSDKYNTRDIFINTMDGKLTNPEFEKSIRSIKGLKSISFINDTPAGLWLTADMQSDELLAIGGLNRIANSGKYEVYQQKNRFRIITNLVALEDESFKSYCKQIGTNPSLFYNAKSPKTIIINDQQDDINSDRRNDIRIKFLKLKVGDKLNCEEKVYEEDTSKYTFQTEVGYLTNQMPPSLHTSNKFQLVQIMPRSTYLNIVNNFSNEKRKMNAHNVSSAATVQSDSQIQSVADKMEDICNSWYGSGDYFIWNMLEKNKVNESAMLLMRVIALFISGFLALIGISNVFSTVSGNLKQRQKEFAILRSVGLPPKGIRRMLSLEALFFGLMPILLSIPVNIILIGIFLKTKMIYFNEFLPYMPILPINVFGAVILLSILLAYIWGDRKISKAAIVDVLKDEAV